jgi:hypothetical protein
MPLDPSIISGIKPAQFDMAQFSPMNALTSAMKFRQADEESQLNALKRKEYENTRLQQENLNKFVRGGEGVAPADFNLPEARRNLLGFGKPGADYSEALSKQETAALAQKKSKFEIQDARKKFVAGAQRDISQNPSDANITAYREDLMANDLFTPDEKKQMAANADRILAMPVGERTPFMSSQGASASELKPSNLQVNQGGQTQVLQMPAFGGAGTSVGTFPDVPLPDAVQAQRMQTAKAGAPKTGITLGGNKYAENVGGDIGKSDVETYKFAQTIPAALAKVDETLTILKNSDINTGLGAELLTTLDRAKTKFAADKKAGVRVSNTEYLNSLLGSEVFPLIQSLGIGARGMDTPAEREFLREVMTGTISLNKDALIRMAEGRKKAMIGSAEQYNKNVKSGELDRFFEASGRNKSTIEIPKVDAAPAKNAVTNPEFPGFSIGKP